MGYFLVVEKVPDTMVGGVWNSNIGAVTQTVVHSSIPNFKDQLITVVEADSAKEAMELVMGATRRVGQYAVIACDYFSYAPDQETVSSPDGVLRKREKSENDPKQLVSKVDQMAEESDKRLEQLEKELDELRKLAR